MEYYQMPEKSPKRRAFLDGMGEAAGLLADSIWQHDVLPRAEVLTATVAHLFAQKAGADTFARLEKCDPTDYDALYCDVRPEIA